MNRSLEHYIQSILKVRQINPAILDQITLQKHRDEIEKKYLGELMKEAETETKNYYETKAKDLIRRQDGNLFIKTIANLLLNSTPELNYDELLHEIKQEK